MYYLYCIYTVFILYFHFDKEPTWFENVNKKNSKFKIQSLETSLHSI